MIRIPVGADIGLRNCLMDVQEKLKELDGKPSDSSALALEVAALREELAALKRAPLIQDYRNVMGASGGAHAIGLTPDTPSSSGSTKFLREDATWNLIASSPSDDHKFLSGDGTFKEPFAGMVQRLGYDEQSVAGVHDILDVNGAMHVAGPLQAGMLTTADAHVLGNLNIAPLSQGNVARRIHVNTTADPVSDGTLQDLMSYAVPAGLLATDGSYLHVVTAGTTAANGNAKVVTINWGAYNVAYVTGVVNNLDWLIEMWVYRISATSQIVVSKGGWNGTMLYCQESTASETLANSITIKCTGDGVAASDITQTLLSVEFYP